MLPVTAAVFSALMLIEGNASGEQIVLSTGEQLSAPITERSNESITIEHPILGVLTISLSSVASIDGVPVGEALEALPDQEVTPSTPTEAKAAPVVESLPEPEWDSKLEIGFTGNAGNTQTANFRIAFTTVRETETNIFNYDAWYQLSSSDGDRTENRFSTGVLSEWPQADEPYSYFAAARYDYAEFQSWDQRLTANAGVKYYFVERETLNAQGNRISAFSFAGRIGAGIRKEWGSDDQDIIPEGLLGLDADWMISPDQNLQFTTTYYPDLSMLGEFRWVNTFDWVIAIHQVDGVSLKIGLLHEYQSEVDPGVKKNDLSAHASLVVDF